MQTTLYEIIESSALAALALQQPNGSMPPGHNGPYHDPETPVRNTGHWLITFAHCYKTTNNPAFRSAAERCIAYLTDREARPMQAAFFCRLNPEKDFANGLVGQAWTIEALCTAIEVFERYDLIPLAREVALLPPYNAKLGAWRVVNVDGSYRTFDFAFNHQLWFAAACGILARFSPEAIEPMVLNFFSRLNSNLSIYTDGLIKHRTIGYLLDSPLKQAEGFVRTAISWKHKKQRPAYMHMKSIGYHGFNLYAFGLLHARYPDHGFWQETKFLKTLDYAQSADFRTAIPASTYGYPYNPPGFEIAYALQGFGRGTMAERQSWVQSQIDNSYESETKMLSRNTPDPLTMAARIYEATRLDDCEVVLG